MKKIKILFCIEYLSSGGTEKQLMSLIEGLHRERFQPYLCCLRNSIIGDSRREEALGLFKGIECPKIQLNFVSLRNVQSLIEILRLTGFVRKHSIDIIQAYFQDPALLGLLAAKLSGVKNVIACFRDMGFWREQGSDLKMVYKLCSGYIANSHAVKSFYINSYDLPDKKFNVIYNGVDIQRYSSIQRKKGPNKKVLTVGILANLNREVKRVDIFLKAAACVLKQTKSIKFLVAGDGELKQDLMRLSEKLEISRNVTFLGRVKDIPQLLSSIDIGVISSDSEGFSNSILEYMAAGVPVVATDAGGNKEIIENGVNGFLVPPGDYPYLAERIMELVNEKDLYNKIRKTALEVIRKDYTLEQCIHKYENHYEQMTMNQVK